MAAGVLLILIPGLLARLAGEDEDDVGDPRRGDAGLAVAAELVMDLALLVELPGLEARNLEVAYLSS